MFTIVTLYSALSCPITFLFSVTALCPQFTSDRNAVMLGRWSLTSILPANLGKTLSASPPRNALRISQTYLQILRHLKPPDFPPKKHTNVNTKYVILPRPWRRRSTTTDSNPNTKKAIAAKKAVKKTSQRKEERQKGKDRLGGAD